jgi:hypothetical protein
MRRTSRTSWVSDDTVQGELLIREPHGIKVIPAFCTPEQLAELGDAIRDCLEYINYEPPKKPEAEP